MTTTGSDSTLSPRDRRRLSAAWTDERRIETNLDEQRGAMRHCVQRLVERFDVNSVYAADLVMQHFLKLKSNHRERYLVKQRGETQIYRIEDEDDGDVYYPVMRPGRVSGRHIIVTYLTAEMVFREMIE